MGSKPWILKTMNMKHLKNIFKTIFIILVIISCDDTRDLDYLDNIAVPSNVSATFEVTAALNIVFAFSAKCK